MSGAFGAVCLLSVVFAQKRMVDLSEVSIWHGQIWTKTVFRKIVEKAIRKL